MIFITGDTHGSQGVLNRLNTENFYEQKEFDSNDKDKNIVIILGDFGCIWSNNPEHKSSNLEILNGVLGEDKEEKYVLNWLQNKPFTTVFIDGNHDNHPRINTYPITNWHKGKVHQIRENVFHLIRGEIYEIENHTFFAFGGAASHDIQDGILDPTEFENYKNFRNKWKQYYNQNKMFRIKNYSWWESELPTEEEMQHGLKNLEKHNWQVDFILSHCCATSTMRLIDRYPYLYQSDILTDYFEEIRCKTNYSKWLFGHFHNNIQINSKDILLFEQLQPLILNKQKYYDDIFDYGK